MADDETVAAAGEAAIGYQRNILAQPLAHDGGGDAQHFAHARPAFGPLVANDDDVARQHLIAFDSGQAVLLGVVTDGRAAEAKALFAGDLRHRAGLGEVAVEDLQVARLFDWIFHGHDDLLALAQVGDVGQVFGECLTGDGHAIAVQEAFAQEHLLHGRDAADLV